MFLVDKQSLWYGITLKQISFQTLRVTFLGKWNGLAKLLEKHQQNQRVK